jgi:hypothetical protein
LLIALPRPARAQSTKRVEGGVDHITDLNATVAADLKTTWFELAQLAFPDLDRTSRLFHTSEKYRQIAEPAKTDQVRLSMQVMSLETVWFLSNGAERLAVLYRFQLREQPKPPAPEFFLLAVYSLERTPTLVDLIDAQLFGSKGDTAHLEGHTELDVGRGRQRSETLWLVNTERTAPTAVAEDNRFLLLDQGTLRVVASSPRLANSEDCDRVTTQTFHTEMRRQFKAGFPLYRFHISTLIQRNEKCSRAKWFFSENRESVFAERWDPRERIFRERRISVDQSIAAWAYGSAAEEKTQYDSTVEFPRAYTAAAVYDSRYGLRLLHPPVGTPGAQVHLAWLDLKGLLPKGRIRHPIRATLVFQVLGSETRFLRNNRLKVTHDCLVYAFGRRAWWNTPG